MPPENHDGNKKDKRGRGNSPFDQSLDDLSLSERAPKREKVETDLTLEIGANGPTPQQYNALTGFARDAAHTVLAYHANGDAVPPVTVSGPLPMANQVQKALNLVITSYLPHIERDMPGDQRLGADRIIINTASPSGTATTVSLPRGTAVTPAPRLTPQPLPRYNTNITSPPSPPPNSRSLAQSSSQTATPTQSTNPPLPQGKINAAKRNFKGGGSKPEWFPSLWGVLLTHPEPMGISDLTNSGDLPPKFPVSRMTNYLLAMKEVGLVVENGQAGKASLYSPVAPSDISPTERQALLDWAQGLPALACAAANTHLSSRPNILRLPGTLYAQLVQNTKGKSGNTENRLLASRAFEVLLTAEKPLSQQEIADRLKENHHFPNAIKGTVAPYLNAMVAASLASSPTAGTKTTASSQYSARIPLPTELLSDPSFQRFIDNLPDVNDRGRARQRSDGIDPIAQQDTTTVPPAFLMSDTLKNALHPGSMSRSSLAKENALRVWSVLLANDPTTNKELETALSGTAAAKESRYYTQWLQRSNMAAVDRKNGNTIVYTGTVPPGLETNNDLRSWVAGLPETMKVKAQNRLDNPFVVSVQQGEPPVPPPLPPRIAQDFQAGGRAHQMGFGGARASQILGILLRTSTPLTSDMIQARLKSEHNVDVSVPSVNRYRSYLGSENLVSLYGKDSLTDLYVGCVPESLRNDPGLAEWAAELADVGGRANARARIGGTEPLGAARLLPPLPAVLRDAFGNSVGQKRAAATLAVLISTGKPLTLQELAEVVQRDYRLSHGKATALADLAKMRTSGLLKEMDKTRDGYFYTAVVPAGLVEVSAQERDALCEWARGALSGRAQADALARI
ncbi:hypothetical protein FKR81_42965, partial [Lentzea tibetensis]